MSLLLSLWIVALAGYVLGLSHAAIRQRRAMRQAVVLHLSSLASAMSAALASDDLDEEERVAVQAQRAEVMHMLGLVQ